MDFVLIDSIFLAFFFIWVSVFSLGRLVGSVNRSNRIESQISTIQNRQINATVPLISQDGRNYANASCWLAACMLNAWMLDKLVNNSLKKSFITKNVAFLTYKHSNNLILSEFIRIWNDWNEINISQRPDLFILFKTWNHNAFHHHFYLEMLKTEKIQRCFFHLLILFIFWKTLVIYVYLSAHHSIPSEWNERIISSRNMLNGIILFFGPEHIKW